MVVYWEPLAFFCIGNCDYFYIHLNMFRDISSEFIPTILLGLLFSLFFFQISKGIVFI